MSNIWDSLTERPSGLARLRQPAVLPQLCPTPSPHSLSQTWARPACAFASDRYLRVLASTTTYRWRLHPWSLWNVAQRPWPCLRVLSRFLEPLQFYSFHVFKTSTVWGTLTYYRIWLPVWDAASTSWPTVSVCWPAGSTEDFIRNVLVSLITVFFFFF